MMKSSKDTNCQTFPVAYFSLPLAAKAYKHTFLYLFRGSRFRGSGFTSNLNR